MDRPVVGLVCCTRNAGQYLIQAVLERYIMAAVRFAQADVLLIPSIPDLQNARRALRRLDVSC